ncbi:MAG: restriction endonuclease subunit S [Saprospiraceae bacterium]|nr:restriction endonuclease subunit S [Saprospiraceae bacterium]MDW8230938.1 restriction endonuclease subunit S [Saprospiraceae bacterium]
MNRIEKLIQQLCPDGVEYRALGEVASVKTGTQLNKSLMSAKGNYPVFNGGIRPSGFHTKYNTDANTIAVSQGGASAGFVNYVETKFWAGAHCFVIKPITIDLLNKFLYYALKRGQNIIMSSKVGAGIPGLSRKEISQFPIPLPPLPIQEAIVEVLDAFSQLEAELEAELEARKKQYAYYRERLLSFDGRKDVVWRTLGEVAIIGTGSRNTNESVSNGAFPFFVRSQEPLMIDKFDFDETAIITAGDGVGVGKVFHFIKGKYALHQRAYRIKVISANLHPKFLFYFIRSDFARYLKTTSVHSSVTSLRRPMFEKYPIPLPSLSEQERIVGILDKFEALVSDLSVGLPAELEARRKQYAYYRERLLTFRWK